MEEALPQHKQRWLQINQELTNYVKICTTLRKQKQEIERNVFIPYLQSLPEDVQNITIDDQNIFTRCKLDSCKYEETNHRLPNETYYTKTTVTKMKYRAKTKRRRLRS